MSRNAIEISRVSLRETGKLQKLVRYLFMQRGNISRNIFGRADCKFNNQKKLNHLSGLILKEATCTEF